MRLSDSERGALIGAVKAVDVDAQVWLFGSRTDDSKKGGDIDVAILSKKIGLAERMRIRRNITDRIGDQKIDLVVSADGSDPFFRLAVETGVRLDE
ncbi:MAG: nucleotidyltransferase domain-containing protein [Spirochaetales bacterium]|jgi:predicted nucleotidyltransferase|nr:nucleotidyltransferase domain-containing protein [Spirochaetales bacterium]